MKQKRRGFTLIELLAVIVILTIIAIIAVPVIMNIISSARESAFEDTAYGLISAGEMYYAASLLDSGMVEDAEFIITDGEFVGENKLEVKGALPTSGKIKVTRDGKVALAITNGAMCITKGYDDSKIDPEADVDNCELPKEPAKTLSELAKTNEFATTIHVCATSGECAVGTPFAIEVAPNVIKNFYVVSEENNTVTLIMDRNVDDETVGWGGANGPITALNYLESKTANWINIEERTYVVKDDGPTKAYDDITRTNARARLLTYAETNELIETNSWLYGNLNDNSIPPYGFWLSASGELGNPFAIAVVYGGTDTGIVNNSDFCYGVRPVIEISK